MAQISYRANLSSAIFPMTLARAGRSVIIPGPDQSFDRRVDPSGEQKDAGIPQIIYVENVLPTSNGYQSIGLRATQSLGPAHSTDPGFLWETLALIVPGMEHKHVFIANGQLAVKYTLSGYTWETAVVIGTPISTFLNFFSTATVKGVCYFHVESRLYTVTYPAAVLTFTEITASVLPAGFMTGVKSICGAFNYLVLLKTDNTVYHSSTLSATDFQPSLITGAGSSGVSNTSGNLNFLRSCPTGYYLYAEGNIILATYTGNARYPWRFTPVESSEGVQATYQASGDPTNAEQYCISRAGTLLQLTKAQATQVAPEVSELGQRLTRLDTFSYSLNTFGLTSTQASLGRVAYLLDRYVCVSVAYDSVNNFFGPYDEIIIYDKLLNRYGKVKIVHTSIIDLQPSFYATVRSLVIFNANTGNTSVVLVDVTDNVQASEMAGVILLGKYQYVRSRFLCMDEISIETAGPVTVHTYASLDGKLLGPAVASYEIPYVTGASRNYLSSTEGKNVSVLVKGAFDLSSVELAFHVGGSL